MVHGLWISDFFFFSVVGRAKWLIRPDGGGGAGDTGGGGGGTGKGRGDRIILGKAGGESNGEIREEDVGETIKRGIFVARGRETIE